MRKGFILFLASSLLLLTVACGGNVVVDAEGAAGGAPVSCTDACKAQQAAGCTDDIDVCMFRCAFGRSNAAGCVEQYDAAIACVSTVSKCLSPSSCSPQWEAYSACILHASCENDFCTPSGCTATCGGIEYRTDCAFTQKTCSCLVGGATVGSCQPPHEAGSGYLDGDLTLGCCAPFFEAAQ